MAGFAQAWAEGGGLWIEKLAIEGSFRRRGLCRRFLELLAQHATGVFRLTSLRTSEAAWTGLGFETIGRNSEGLKLMQCPISVFLHGSPPQQEELTSSQQREPGADDLERTLLQSQRRCEELERKSVTMAHQCENLEGMLAQSQWVAEEAQARAGDLERMVLQSQRRCEDLEQKSAENLEHLLAQTRYCEELERKNVALAHQCENLEHLLGQARSVAEAAQSQADALEHMLFQSQRRCEDLGQKNLAVAQQCENLEHVLLQVTTRPGFEEAHAQAIFKKYLDLRDWTAEQLVRRAEYAEFQHWSCWPAAHMWAC